MSQKGHKQKEVITDLIPVRMKCQCMAQVHQLINNCLVCGRIVCQQQNVGPCFFCNNQVYKKGEQPKFDDQFDEFPEFETQAMREELQKKQAIAHKNKMLQYDKSDFIKRNVYDEQTDWYQIADDVWQSEETRNIAVNQLIEKKEIIEENDQVMHQYYDPNIGAWREKDYHFNEEDFKLEAQEFYNDTITEESQIQKDEKAAQQRLIQSEKFNEKHLEIIEGVKEDMELMYDVKQMLQNKAQNPQKPFVECSSTIQIIPQFQERLKELRKYQHEGVQEEAKAFDQELYSLEQTDVGMCLSMLQPWASLLVEGFKRFEGRFWSDDYRGPLWIHAGATPPQDDVIQKIEKQYQDFYANVEKMPPLPQRYPLGSLIGMVDLQTVISKEQYFKKVPDGQREQTDSEYLFVVRNPRKLYYPVKMKGKQKLFAIDNELRQTCRQSLSKVKSTWFDWIAKDLYDVAPPTNLKKTLLIKKESAVSEDKKQQDNDLPSGLPPKLDQKMSSMHEDLLTKVDKLRQVQNIQLIPEQFGLVLNTFLSNVDIQNLTTYFLKQTEHRKQYGPSQITSIELDNQIPNIEIIIDKLIKIEKSINKRSKEEVMMNLSSIDIFFTGQKQKNFDFDEKYYYIFFIGSSVELTIYDCAKAQSRPATISNGCSILPKDQQLFKISYEKCLLESQEPISNYGLKGDLHNLFICFSALETLG